MEAEVSGFENTIRDQQVLRFDITGYDIPRRALSIALDQSYVQGLLDLTPQVAGQIFHDKNDPRSVPCEEVANDVGVTEKSQQMRFPDLRSWDADVLRWFLQKFIHSDCFPFVVAPPETTMSASTELHQLSVWVLRIACSATVVRGLFARGDCGALFLVRTSEGFSRTEFFKCGSRNVLSLAPLVHGNFRVTGRVFVSGRTHAVSVDVSHALGFEGGIREIVVSSTWSLLSRTEFFSA